MQFKTSDNFNIHYEYDNCNAAKTLVFLNGLSQSTIAWGLMIPALKGKFNILLLDFIFQGQSDKNSEVRDFDQHAKDVFELMDYLKIEKATLCGISYGSLVAQNFAVNYPQKTDKLILMSTFAHKTPYFNAIENSWWMALQMGGYGLLLDVMLPTVLSDTYFESPLIPIDLMKNARKDLNPSPESLFKLMTATKQRPDYRKNLENIKIPTLIIHGEKDLLLPMYMATEVQKHIAGSRLEVIKNLGHTLNLEAPKQCVDLILGFV